MGMPLFQGTQQLVKTVAKKKEKKLAMPIPYADGSC